MALLTKNERQIMELIWDANRPLSRQEILDGTEGRSWNPASIHLILNNMQSKGVLKIQDEDVRYGRTYAASMSKEEYILLCLDGIVAAQDPQEQTVVITKALIAQPNIDLETLQEIKNILMMYETLTEIKNILMMY